MHNIPNCAATKGYVESLLRQLMPGTGTGVEAGAGPGAEAEVGVGARPEARAGARVGAGAEFGVGDAARLGFVLVIADSKRPRDPDSAAAEPVQAAGESATEARH